MITITMPRSRSIESILLRAGFSGPLPPTQMEGTDVYALLSKDCADTSNHAGHVAIVKHQHVATRNRFDAKLIDFGDPAFTRAGYFKDRPGDGLLDAFRNNPSPHRRGQLSSANIRSRNRDPSLFSNHESVDDVHPRANVA